METFALKEKIKNRSARIGVVGLGYVGLPLSLLFSESGYMVTGFDIDKEKIKKINSEKESYISHISHERIKTVVEGKKFFATIDVSLIAEQDVIILCLPTPLNEYREPDLSYVLNTMQSIKLFFKKEQLLCFESTTYPGTTEEVLRPIIESQDLEIGREFFLVYSPEREDPGNAIFTTKNVPKIVGGSTSSCLEHGVSLYENIIDKVIPVSSTATAELTKLLENIYRSVNIGLVNEMKIVADKMGIDIWEVINAASSKPFGFTPFYPGPGWGGHCIPIDPFYLTWKAREFGVNTKFIELAGEINIMMPDWVLNKVIFALNEREKALKNSRILVLGLAYKKNIDDSRESPSVKIMELLRANKAIIDYSDPYVKVFPKMREHYFDLASVEINEMSLSKYDCVIIGTDHDNFDYDLIQKNSKLIVDTRGRYKSQYHNVVKA